MNDPQHPAYALLRLQYRSCISHPRRNPLQIHQDDLNALPHEPASLMRRQHIYHRLADVRQQRLDRS
jgi:hypothetical protein